MGMFHELEGFLQHLRNAVFHIATQRGVDVLVEVEDSDGLGDILDGVCTPQSHCGIGVAEDEVVVTRTVVGRRIVYVQLPAS